VLALREEWMGEQDEQFRIPGGCDQMINHLARECLKSGGLIHVSSPVTKIKWQENDATATTGDKKIYNGNKIIITVSLGALLTEPHVIRFEPLIDGYLKAAQKIGYGTVIKVLLQFSEPFWEKKKKDIGFLFTNEIIPTWWTPLPSSYPLLTGWAGGPQAWELENKDDKTILHLALQSLSNVFKKPVPELKQLLTASLVANWSKDPFAKGGYSYSMIESMKSQKLFSKPIDNTIYFAGEAFYDGPSPGTVEAALVSAKNVVERMNI
jgi:monoamine oxidase